MSVTFDIADIDIPAGEIPDADSDVWLGDEGLHGDDWSDFNKFEGFASGWNSAISAINDHISDINGVLTEIDMGPLPDLSEYADLEAMVIYPISGNYRQIRANADACHKIDTYGTQELASNIGQVSGKLLTRDVFRGEAAAALAAQMSAFNIVLLAAGKAISLADVAFEGISQVSERLARVVKIALVRLAEAALSLLKQLAKRFGAGSWSVAVFLLECVATGGGPVRELYEAIMGVKSGIEALLTLKSEIEGWVDTVQTSLQDLNDFVDQIKSLPDVGGSATVDDLPPVSLADIKEAVANVETEFGDTTQGADDAVNGVEDGAS